MRADDGEEKNLRTVSFVIHATRGILRDQATRRKAMFGIIALAMLMMVAGSTVLAPLIEPHEHAVLFILFWLACAWLTISALLLALLDVLIVRVEGRAARKLFREQCEQGQSTDSPTKRLGEQ